MNKAKVQKNISNLKKIKEIIEISKFDTLQKLQKASKISNTYLEMALSAKGLIDFASETYKIKNKEFKVKESAVIWVYATPEVELMSISNAKFEKIIAKDFNPELDLIIALGDKAIKFAHKMNYNIAYESMKSSGTEEAISSSISTSIISGAISEIRFVLNSPKVKDKALTIYPMDKLDLKTMDINIDINKNYKFYPSIQASLQSLLQIYIYRIVFALIKETQYFHLKEKLIRHEGSIKSVDGKIEDRIREMNKLNRKLETEELILVSQIAKRGDDNE